MSRISKILQAQAQAVLENNDKVKQAEALEAAARILRQQAAKPVATKFSEEKRKSKHDRLDRMGAAFAQMKRDEQETALKAAGWLIAIESPDKSDRMYGRKDKPGMQLKISGGMFSVNYGQQILHSSMEVAHLKRYLQFEAKKK